MIPYDRQQEFKKILLIKDVRNLILSNFYQKMIPDFSLLLNGLLFIISKIFKDVLGRDFPVHADDEEEVVGGLIRSENSKKFF